MTVYAFDPDRVNNARLIEDCHELGYLKDDDLILDPTFGKGRFWKLWEPRRLVKSDIKGNGLAVNCVDFTNMVAYTDAKFDAVVFDPPYKLNGTGGSHPSDEGYGVADKLSIADRHDLMCLGLTECIRVTKPKGFILAKCQDQVASGKVNWQTEMLTDWAIGKRCRRVDMLFVHGSREQPRPQQVHARRNYSTCLVFKKGK